jgi:hypothetical protein
METKRNKTRTKSQEICHIEAEKKKPNTEIETVTETDSKTDVKNVFESKTEK